MNPLDRLTLMAIVAYQRHLSPRKGFRCAHRILHGGPSCSESIHQTVAAVGLWRTLPVAHARLRACRAAALHLADRREDDEARRKRRRDAILDCLPDACPVDACPTDACPDQCVPDSCARRGG